MGSAPFPNRPFQLRDVTTLVRQEVANNRSLLHAEVWIDKTGTSPTWSAGGPAYTRWGWDSVVRQEANPGSFDFRGTGPWRWQAGDFWVPHNANGTKSITVNVGGDFALLGATTFDYGMVLPTIPRNPPPATIPLTLDEITRNSMRYRFSSGGDGGSPIIRWEVQYSTSADFTTGTVLITSSGTSVVTGLKPGVMYYWRSRGVNAAGNGAWSIVMSARTLSGAWISDGTDWLPALVFISNGTDWLPANSQISTGAAWVPTG